MTAQPDWIAADWGTSNLRVWGLSADNEIIFKCESDQGMSSLTPQDYPGVLEKLLRGRISPGGPAMDLVICGMAGAKQGWTEAPYLQTPADLSQLGRDAATPSIQNQRLKPRILSGVCHNVPGQEDVMRGEETQILGLLALKPNFFGTICMPGTHSKWVKVADGRIIEFSTAMTGELYSILSAHSVLRHSLNGDLDGPENDAGTTTGLEVGIAAPDRLTGNLFTTRAASLLSSKTPDWCAGYLSGLLIGAEVAGHKEWLGTQSLPLIGSTRLCKIYTRALEKLGVKSEPIDATNATIAGLSAARKQIQ